MRYKKYIELADNTESIDFRINDYVNFLYNYKDRKDIEIVGLITSWLGYGDESMAKRTIGNILINIMHNAPYDYVMSGEWDIYKDNNYCLYKHITWRNFTILCEKLRTLYRKYDSIEDAIIELSKNKRIKKCRYYPYYISELLGSGSMIQMGNISNASYRLNRYLKWMIRCDSVVDLGIWTELNPNNLLLPCDSFTFAYAKDMGICSALDENDRNVIRITDWSRRIFVDDPSRMYYALCELNKDRCK